MTARAEARERERRERQPEGCVIGKPPCWHPDEGKPGHRMLRARPAPQWFRERYHQDLLVCECGMVLNWPMA